MKIANKVMALYDPASFKTKQRRIMQVPVELKIKYLSRRMHDIRLLRASLENDDYSFALKLGHQVKGNAVTFDVPQIAFLGLEMEQAAQRKDKEEVKILIQKMESALTSIQSHF
jgi:HPt (histidine-containing phosphotransfer) domain-containing protein